MRTLLIIWHSQTGGTEQMVRAMADAAHAQTQGDIRVVTLCAREARAADVVDADALVLATPENLAAISGRMKTFFDLHYYALLDRCIGKPYAVMVCAGTEGWNAVAQLERIALGLRLRKIAAPIVIHTGAQTPEAIEAPKQLTDLQLQPCRELGQTLAEALALDVC